MEHTLWSVPSPSSLVLDTFANRPQRNPHLNLHGSIFRTIVTDMCGSFLIAFPIVSDIIVLFYTTFMLLFPHFTASFITWIYQEDVVVQFISNSTRNLHIFNLYNVAQNNSWNWGGVESMKF